MNRWTGFTICVLLALLLLVCGWLMPVHLRGVEMPVLKRAGQGTPALPTGDRQALQMLQPNQPTNGFEAVTGAWTELGPELKMYFPAESASNRVILQGVVDFVIREDNRNHALKTLQSSRQPAVHELLQSRALTNTAIFAPSQAPGGEAFDAAVAMTGILLDQGKLTSGLSSEINTAALQANHNGNPERLE